MLRCGSVVGSYSNIHDGLVMLWGCCGSSVQKFCYASVKKSEKICSKLETGGCNRCLT